MTPNERRVVAEVQKGVEALQKKMLRATAGWWYVRARTVTSWSKEMEEVWNQLNYLSVMAATPLPAAPSRHPCHDQYCYDSSRHACHQAGCEQC